MHIQSNGSPIGIYKQTRLTPIHRKEIYLEYHEEDRKLSCLAETYHISRPTICMTIQCVRQRPFSMHRSTSKRFCCLKYGIKRLSKIEETIEARLKKQANRYNKEYPGQILHGDAKHLPLPTGESLFGRRGYLFVIINYFFRELYNAILPDKTQVSERVFLE